ncbi:nucleotide-binding universal stress UspA family protein [Amaricoccus macauensis]|uniref:Nucleotide-binding universal stress UspA family protein n=1 Tax=Amaricoccus macauensis TaxID=57001 RepID=A0A840SRC5_9RHOB|nr:universal stress protein [Amaricoccus macauensis]MBB5221771.1 nucleotide-binding universal stress UspA family protein [Amaricoccus macauensis]
MAFRTIFMAVGTADSDAEIDRAVAICERAGAHLALLVIGVAPPPPASPYGVVSNDIWAGEIRDGQTEAQARAEALEARFAGSPVSVGVEAQYIDRGTIATLAARFARYADLTLVPPNCDVQSPVLDGALFESGRPVLLLPTSETDFPTPKTVMIAWNASVQASKAVRSAIAVMQTAEKVHAVLIDPVPSFDGHGPEPGADLATYLGRHGITTEVHRLPKEGKDTGEMLRRVATDLGADLVVMGGYGHSRLRERIFGGATTSMVKTPSVAVLMAH